MRDSRVAQRRTHELIIAPAFAHLNGKCNIGMVGSRQTICMDKFVHPLASIGYLTLDTAGQIHQGATNSWDK